MIAASVSVGVTTVVALTMLGPSGLAVASPAMPTAAALNFNVFVEGDADLVTNESEGPVALGGNLTIGGTFQVGGASPGTFVAPGDGTTPSALVIGGRIDFPASAAGAVLFVQNSAYEKLGDPTGAQVLNVDSNNATGNTHTVAAGATYESTPRVELRTTQPVASVLQSPINFAAAFADFRSTTTSLATCANTVILTNAQGQPLPRPLPPGTNAFLTLIDGVTNVLNISGADLNNITTLTFVNRPTATRPLLINVDTSADNTYSWTVPTSAGIGGTDAPYILWNFPTATQIIQMPNSATLEGTLYAPNADLIDLSAANNEGQIIAASIVMEGGEVHYFPFAATLNCGLNSSATPTATPTVTPTATPTTRPPYGRPHPSWWH